MLDWIADIVPRDGKRKPFRIGISRHLTEEQASAEVFRLLQWRKVGLCHISLVRRSKSTPFRRPTDERILKRYVDI